MKKIARFNLKTQPHDALFDFILFVHKSLIYLPQAETTPGQPEVQRAEGELLLKSERLQRVVDNICVYLDGKDEKAVRQAAYEHKTVSYRRICTIC